MINGLLIYLIKVTLAISLVTLPYYLFLRNDSLLVVKRAYLIGGIVSEISQSESPGVITRAFYWVFTNIEIILPPCRTITIFALK